MNKEYYIRESGRIQGPFTFNELLLQSLNLDTQVAASANGRWIAAAEYPELSAYFHAQGTAIVNEDDLASFWLRLAAYVIDLVLFFFLIMIAAIVYAATTSGNISEADVQNNRDLIQLVGTLLLLLYNAALEATPLQGSVGKMLVGLHVVDQDGRRLKFSQSIMRNLGKIVSSLLFGLGYLYIFFNPYRQALHDQLAKTYVIRKPYIRRY